MEIKKKDPQNPEALITLDGMYQNYFLDYASYVILERAVPALEDGLKPVQRRILHAMKEMDDGRFHKVANIIGQTMQYHPHGDAAIGDALVNLGQKDLLIDTQGNWGDVRTGDSAAAPRYIEARLTKFALEVAFNGDLTEWQLTYDGRKKEPITLPMKFPMAISQGVEGIAVGLSTKILPHNFIELCEGSIQILKGKTVQLYPDFQTGGLVDVSNYQAGRRGGKVRVRAKIEVVDRKMLYIKNIPFGVTTGSMIDSILKANDKGLIKIKKVIDNTAKDVEIQIELQPGIAPDVTMDALYAFTNCEVSISPNACVITQDKPVFLSVDEILELSTKQTRDLLGRELGIELADLEEKWLFTNLEKIFIENRVYHKIEECETWEAVIETIDREMRRYVATPADQVKNDKRVVLGRNLGEEDWLRLTEIKIKRISKFNSFKADELLISLEKQIAEIEHHLAHLTDFSIQYFKNLILKYGKGRERQTEIAVFDTIQAAQVVANNAKLYVDLKEGFFGFGMKKDEFVCDCSDIDDIIAIRRDGKMVVKKIGDKVFAGKDILYIAVWRKNDERTTYNLLYLDGESGFTLAKRFNVTGITRDKEYDLSKGTKNSKILYLSAHANGESEIVNIQLTPGCKAKIKVFDFDFSEILIKNRGSQGNIMTRYPIRKLQLKELGKSTLGAQEYSLDDITGRINTEGRGQMLGSLDTGDTLFVLYPDGTYELAEFDPNRKFQVKDFISIAKFSPKLVVSAIYYDGTRGFTLVKRFHIETSGTNNKLNFLTEHKDSKLLYASIKDNPRVRYSFKIKSKKMDGELNLAEFIDVKGWKAAGNKLSDQMLLQVSDITPAEVIEEKLHPGDTIEFDVDNSDQPTLFD